MLRSQSGTALRSVINVVDQASVVVEQAGEDPYDGDHNAEHDSDGDVRAAKLRIVLTYHA